MVDAMNDRNEWMGVGKSYENADHKRITLTQRCGTAMFLHREAICLFQCHLILAANFFCSLSSLCLGQFGGAFCPFHPSDLHPHSSVILHMNIFMYEWSENENGK
jgi:hypothetical protein